MKKYNNEHKELVSCLSEAQLVQFSLIYRQFEKGIISYRKMIKVLEESGINVISPNVKSKNRFKLLKDAENFQERVNTEDYLSSDLTGLEYQVSGSDEVKSFYYNREMLELLARYGDEEAIQTLENIEQFQHRHISNYHPKSYRH